MNPRREARRWSECCTSGKGPATRREVRSGRPQRMVVEDASRRESRPGALQSIVGSTWRLEGGMGPGEQQRRACSIRKVQSGPGQTRGVLGVGRDAGRGRAADSRAGPLAGCPRARTSAASQNGRRGRMPWLSSARTRREAGTRRRGVGRESPTAACRAPSRTKLLDQRGRSPSPKDGQVGRGLDHMGAKARCRTWRSRGRKAS